VRLVQQGQRIRAQRVPKSSKGAILALSAGADYVGIDLLADGVPCPPVTIAGPSSSHRDRGSARQPTDAAGPGWHATFGGDLIL
jgi:hypothetical protein